MKNYISYYCGGSSCAEQGDGEMKTGLILHKGWKEGPFVTKNGWTRPFWHSDPSRLTFSKTPMPFSPRSVIFFMRVIHSNLAFALLFQGKYVEIQFTKGGQPDGGKISNFLLEKVIVGFGFFVIILVTGCLLFVLMSSFSSTTLDA